MDMEVFLQKERIFPGALKNGATIYGPRIADKKFYGHEAFFWFTVTNGSEKGKEVSRRCPERLLGEYEEPLGLAPYLCCLQKILEESGTKKRAINIKNLGRNPPPRPPPPRGPWPRKFFMLGPLFLSEYRKKAYIKNFDGGGSWGPQNSLCWISSRAFFLHLKETTNFKSEGQKFPRPKFLDNPPPSNWLPAGNFKIAI